jgi:hypothetical protein
LPNFTSNLMPFFKIASVFLARDESYLEVLRADH